MVTNKPKYINEELRKSSGFVGLTYSEFEECYSNYVGPFEDDWEIYLAIECKLKGKNS